MLTTPPHHNTHELKPTITAYILVYKSVQCIPEEQHTLYVVMK